jgi:glucokinase
MASAESTSGRAEPADVLVGVDIGGTGTRFVALTPGLDLVARAAIATPRDVSTSDAFAALASGLRSVSDGHRPLAIGIGASGPVDPAGIIRNPDTLPAFTDVGLVDWLRDEFRVPVAIDNDAVCAAIAEHDIGAGRGARSMVHVTLGTGVGVALLLDGTPVRGADGQHPEAGHITVSGTTARCYCGRESCWEQRATRRSLQRTAAGVLDRDQDDAEAISDLARRAAAGDPDARTVFDQYGAAVAEGLATLLAVHRPATVVLGGSAAEHFDLLERGLWAALGPLGSWISHPTIRRTELDDFGGAVGGALLALRTVAPAR